MRKFIALLLVFALVFSFTAYGTANTSSEEPNVSGMTTVPMSSSLETLTNLTTYDLLPVIKSVAVFMKAPGLTTVSNAKYVEDKALTTDAISLLRDETDNRINDIRNTPNLTIPSNAKVYYVSNSGNDSNNGLTPNTAWASLSKASSVAGSASTKTYVLFERGGVWRGQLVTSSYVTYSAYGKGDKPKLYASPFNAGGSTNASKWVKNSGNIWTITSSQLKSDVGALVFDDSLYAIKKLKKSDVKSDLDFYHDYKNGIIYLYSATNPANRFKSIEFNLGQHIVKGKSYVTIDNLCIKFGGNHGVSAGSSYSLTVKNCEFGWIGGSLQNPASSTTRYGNAVEIWGYCSDFTVIDNYIYQIYDAGITQQITLTDNTLRKHERVLYSGNVIENCNYSIEYWITSTNTNPSYIDTFLIEDNLMWYAGYGLCQTRSDKVNACHIQGWRHYNRNRAKNYVVRNNVMIDSLDQLVNIYSTEVNVGGGNSMPMFNNNIMLNKESGKFGVLHQGARGDTSWPGTVLLEKSLFESVDDVFNGDIIGIIDRNLYKNGLLTVPNGVTNIGDYAFNGCSGLTSITIGDSVKSIGDYAFNGCSGLTSITIPDSVTSIGKHAFNGCSGLTSVTIGDSVTSIGDYAFDGYTGLTSVTIGDSVTGIGDYAFNGCSGLTSVIIPDSVKSIGSHAFDGCTGLTSITFGDSVTSIGNFAFRGCSGLTSVTIPDSVKSIGNYAFNGCSGLTSITFGGSVTNIGAHAFNGCSRLTSVIIPNSVTSIGGSAFRGCSGLRSITLPFVGATLDGTSHTHFGYIFGASSYSNNNSYLPASLKKVIITAPSKNIDSYAFFGCSGLVSVTVPDSVASIGNYAFRGCVGLASITIPDSVTSIGAHAFNGCTGLACVTIPNSVTSIGSYAFEYCTKLTDVWYLGFIVDKENIDIGTPNSVLDNAKWHYTVCSEHKYTHEADTICDYCDYERQVTGAMFVEEDGNKVYYLDGVFQSEVTDLVKFDGISYYIENGIWASSIDTLHKINGKWFLIKSGIWTATTGLVEYNGKTFYVKDGKWDSSVNELVKLDGKWYFIKSGKWDNTLNSLHKLNGKWFLVEGGMWEATTGLVKYQGKQFYVVGGKWESRNDLVKIGSNYYLIQGGKWNNTKTTIFKKNGKLFAVKNGLWYKSKAIISYSGKKYYCNSGFAQISKTGTVIVGGKKYTVSKGIIK